MQDQNRDATAASPATTAADRLLAASARHPEDKGLALRAGIALFKEQRARDAAACFRRAALDPALAIEAGTRLAEVLMGQGDSTGAMRLLSALADRHPHNDAVLYNLAVALRKAGHYAAALALLDRVATINPDARLLDADRANCQFNLGRIDAARPVFEAILDRGAPREGLSAALMASLYDPELDAHEIRDRHVRAMRGETAGPPLCREVPPLAAGEALRVGFVSADFAGLHPVAQFMLPLLAAFPDLGIAPTVYVTAHGRDGTAAALDALPGIARVSLAGFGDAEAAARIAKDAPHLLIDLSGQTAQNRLSIFSRRPAAAQATYLGYPSTTGHPAIDALIADPVLIPEDHEDRYSETIFRVPAGFLCFAPPAGMPEPGVATSGRLRLGSLNHLPKLTPRVLSLWAEAMAGLPEAELFIKCAAFSETATRNAVREVLVSRGVAPQRLILEGPSDFTAAMADYRGIDVSLDPFPYGGGTTSCHALWMGSPVVTIAGDRFASRMGASILTAAGHPEWIASDPADWLRKVAALGADLPALRELRRALLREIPLSPLCDVARHARAMSATFHEIVAWARARPAPSAWTPPASGLMAAPLPTQHLLESGKVPPAQRPTGRPPFEISTSRHFGSFLAEAGGALVLSAPRAGMVVLIGTDPVTKRLTLFNRQVERPTGLACDRGRLCVASPTQIVTFVDGHLGTPEEGADPVYVPQVAHFTGDLDVHDLAFDGVGELVFVNTLFSCLAKLSTTHSFRPIWQPPFVTALAAEDRCHLNGLAMRAGAPAFVTALALSNVAKGWHAHGHGGGLLIDVASSEIVAAGLSMPQSPRWHDGRLWVLNAGSGELGTVAPDTGAFTTVAFCPGHLRGLAFLGPYAIVGSSRSPGLDGLPLHERLEREGTSPRCGLFVVDTRAGDVVHWLEIQGIASEVFDVAVIPKARSPTLIGFRADEVRRTISIAP